MPDLDWIRKLCLSFPDVTEDMPWADDLCFKVRGKIFTGMVLSDGRFPRITLKCTPETFPRTARSRWHLDRPLRRTLQVGDARQLQHPARERTRSSDPPVLRPGRSKGAQEESPEAKGKR